jgi:hypothetical protein
MAKMRCSLETRLIVPNQAPVPANPTLAQATQRVLAQGPIWNQELLSGKVASVAALAKREKLYRRYVARIVRLAFLSPDIKAESVPVLGPESRGIPTHRPEFAVDSDFR